MKFRMSMTIPCIAWMSATALPLHDAIGAKIATAYADATIETPSATVSIDQDLDFGVIIPGSKDGSVTINATTGVRTCTNVTGVGTASPAKFSTHSGSTGNWKSITVSVPNGELKNIQNSQVMTVSTSIREVNKKMNGGSFWVGATLNVRANQAPGVYSGIMDVIVNY